MDSSGRTDTLITNMKMNKASVAVALKIRPFSHVAVEYCIIIANMKKIIGYAVLKIDSKSLYDD